MDNQEEDLISDEEFQRMSYKQQTSYLRSLVENLSEVESDAETIPEINIEMRENESDRFFEDLFPDFEGLEECSDIEDVLADQNLDIELDTCDSDSNFEETENQTVFPACNITQSPSIAGDMVAKDNTIWKHEVPSSSRHRSHNILRQRQGPISSTKNYSAVQTFNAIFSKVMCCIIVKETNRKAHSSFSKWNKENCESKPKLWKELTEQEFDAFLGILITAGVRYSNYEHTKELWRPDAYPLYRASMSLQRFWSICRFIRFDDARTRNSRLLSDKAAAISELWMLLNANLKSNYVPSEQLTVDEQLFPFRGRTRFTQYIPSKPAKYGIKIWWVCDAKSSYPLAGQIYTGKVLDCRDINQGERVVKDLCQTYRGSGRNITMDNFFTSVPLAKLLISWNLSLVGTLKKNKRYIPEEMLDNSRQPLTSTFGFSEDGMVTMCSYVPKKRKSVILISTMHNTKDLVGSKQKPEIIDFYNSTKGGVDNMDKMLTHYTVKRRTQRWPLAMFYNMVDIACLASFIIYKENNPSASLTTNSRRVYLQELGRQLSIQHITARSKNIHVSKHFSTRLAMESMMGHPIQGLLQTTVVQSETPTGRKPIQGSCYRCRALEKRQRKTRKCCCACLKPICNEHCETITKCKDCPFFE